MHVASPGSDVTLSELRLEAFLPVDRFRLKHCADWQKER